MVWLDTAVWTLAVVLFVVGDWVTTRYGLACAGLVERNPLAGRAIDRVGVTAALLALNGVALGLAAGGYLHASGAPSTRQYRLLFPGVVAATGLVTTAHNLRVLVSAHLESGRRE